MYSDGLITVFSVAVAASCISCASVCITYDVSVFDCVPSVL